MITHGIVIMAIPFLYVKNYVDFMNRKIVTPATDTNAII